MSGYTDSDDWLCFFVTALLKVEVEGPAGCHGLQFNVLTSCVASSFTLPVFVLFPCGCLPRPVWFHLCPFSLSFPAFLYSARSSLFLSVHPSKCFYSCVFLIFALQTSPTFFYFWTPHTRESKESLHPQRKQPCTLPLVKPQLLVSTFCFSGELHKHFL